jgi:hypothetical protein
MTVKTLHWNLGVLGLATLVAASACTVTAGGVGYGEADYEYVGGFYEPYGYDYGGWGRGYRVGPPRGEDHGGPHHDGDRGGPGRGPGPDHERGSGGGGGHPYRSAPPGRSMPSIPAHPRGH